MDMSYRVPLIQKDMYILTKDAALVTCFFIFFHVHENWSAWFRSSVTKGLPVAFRVLRSQEHLKDIWKALKLVKVPETIKDSNPDDDFL